MRHCRSSGFVSEFCTKRTKAEGIPSKNAAGPRPELGTPAAAVTLGPKLYWPFRLLSLGRRRFWARRTSVPHLRVWLPWILVQLFTIWNTYSRSFSGQLHWFTGRLKPILKPPFPSMTSEGRPEVSGRLGKLEFGML